MNSEYRSVNFDLSTKAMQESDFLNGTAEHGAERFDGINCISSPLASAGVPGTTRRRHREKGTEFLYSADCTLRRGKETVKLREPPSRAPLTFPHRSRNKQYV